MTVTEAYCFARWLGGNLGNLPTLDQWEKAAGKQFADRLEGPFLPNWKPGQIALGNGPRPVGAATADVSPAPYDCRDMAGNGYEWTRNLGDGRMVPVAFQRSLDQPLWSTRGQNYQKPEPFTFTAPIQSQSYKDSDITTSFRVVLEVPPKG